MFNLSHTLFLVALLLKLMLSVTMGVSVRGSMRIKNSHIEERTLESTTPKTISSDIQSCTILTVRGSAGEHLTING